MLIATYSLAQDASQRPEEVIRSFYKAVYSGDRAAFERLTVPDPRRAKFLSEGSRNETALRELIDDPTSLQIKQKRPFMNRGIAIDVPANGSFPTGTTALYLTAHRRGPTMLSLSRHPDGWKVDLRWLLAMIEMATPSASDPEKGTAHSAVRGLTASLVALDRIRALRFIVPGANLDVLFAGAPRYREPSGHLDAIALEMPIVEIKPGEFYAMPSGRVVEGVQRNDMKVLVGLFGTVELPFVVRRFGSEWRVEPEPYLPLINR